MPRPSITISWFILLTVSCLSSASFAATKAEKKATRQLYVMADKAAEKHGLNPHLFRALVKHESTWKINAVSPMGAIGLTQLMPATAKAVCGIEADELYEAQKNLNCGAKYFSRQLKQFGTVEMALCAYNAGPGLIQKLGRCPNIKVTKRYVNTIKTSWRDSLWNSVWLLKDWDLNSTQVLDRKKS